MAIALGTFVVLFSPVLRPNSLALGPFLFYVSPVLVPKATALLPFLVLFSPIHGLKGIALGHCWSDTSTGPITPVLVSNVIALSSSSGMIFLLIIIYTKGYTRSRLSISGPTSLMFSCLGYRRSQESDSRTKDYL